MTDQQPARHIFGEIGQSPAADPFHGTVGQWVDARTALAVETGMDTFLLGTPDDDAAQAMRFAAEVVPAVRSAVERNRGG